MPYIGEIRLFGGNFEPNGWRFCAGQTLPISEYETLFQLIGTTYGGDGEETFQLPDLRGRVAVHHGQGPGISQNYLIGEQAGVEEVTLSIQQIPAHTHPLLASTGGGSDNAPAGRVLANPPATSLYTRDTPGTAMPAGTIAPAGGSLPHANLGPSVAINYVISLFGEFPSQS
jgi:microcystin-dependent protein